jgi:hypothetical protein
MQHANVGGDRMNEEQFRAIRCPAGDHRRPARPHHRHPARPGVAVPVGRSQERRTHTGLAAHREPSSMLNLRDVRSFSGNWTRSPLRQQRHD